MSQKKNYDWIDDPFKETEQQLDKGMGSGSKLLVGCGCLVAVLVIVVLAFLFFTGFSTILSS